MGYDDAAYHLTIHLADFQPNALEASDWQVAIDELIKFINAGLDDKIVGWYCQNLERCMMRVPKRRRNTFLKGVYQAAAMNGWIVGRSNSE